MTRRPQSPRRSAGGKQADVVEDGKARTVARTPGGSRSTPKGKKPDQPSARKVSAGRGRPAVFTREEILETAKVAFSKAGYANVSLDDLAALLNTGKGTLYYHANRKVDLLVDISTMAAGDAVEIRKIASLDMPPQQRLALAMRVIMRHIIGQAEGSKVYFENESDLPAKFRTALRRRLREIQDAFFEIVTEGVAGGVFRGDPEIITKHIISVCAWPYRWFSPKGKLSLDAFIDSAVRFVLGGVLANPQAERVIEAALASATGRETPAPTALPRSRIKT